MDSKVAGVGDGLRDWDCTYTLLILCMKQISKNLLSSTGNSIQCSVVT